jgi:hypothetical protein
VQHVQVSASGGRPQQAPPLSADPESLEHKYAQSKNESTKTSPRLGPLWVNIRVRSVRIL